MTYNIHVQLRSPELASAIKQLAEAVAGKPLPPLEKPVESLPAVETSAQAVSFDDVHEALVNLKNKKGAAMVREILTAFDCKTVQDIPENKFTEVLQMATGKLEG